MKITAVEACWVQVPLKHEYHVLSRSYLHTNHVLVRLHTDEGLIGVAEGYVHITPEASLSLLKGILAPAVIGLDPRQPAVLHRKMDAALAGHEYIKNAIDGAAYDVWGKSCGMSAAELLGGRFRESVPVCDAIGLLPVEQVKQEARRLVDTGFKQVKLKAGRDFNRDLEMVKAVRQACGSDLQIRMDANTGYRNAAVAIPLCLRLEEAGVDIFEQPIIGSDLEGMAQLADRLTVPLLAHESLATLKDAVAIIKHKAADILNVSPPKAGGLYPAMQIVRYAEAHNIPIMVAGANESGPGNIASAHLGATAHEQPYAGDARTVLRDAETLIKEPIRIEAGQCHLPPGPGLGITLDDAAVERCMQAPWVKVGK